MLLSYIISFSHIRKCIYLEIHLFVTDFISENVSYK